MKRVPKICDAFIIAHRKGFESMVGDDYIGNFLDIEEAYKQIELFTENAPLPVWFVNRKGEYELVNIKESV